MVQPVVLEEDPTGDETPVVGKNGWMDGWMDGWMMDG